LERTHTGDLAWDDLLLRQKTGGWFCNSLQW